jgi:hypothetical protein
VTCRTLFRYKVGDFVDLCTGPHVDSTGLIKGIKFTQVAGHTWPHGVGDVANVPLQRLSGVAKPTKEGIAAWEKQQAEIALRSHRKIGQAQKLFMCVFHTFTRCACFRDCGRPADGSLVWLFAAADGTAIARVFGSELPPSSPPALPLPRAQSDGSLARWLCRY